MHINTDFPGLPAITSGLDRALARRPGRPMRASDLSDLALGEWQSWVDAGEVPQWRTDSYDRAQVLAYLLVRQWLIPTREHATPTLSEHWPRALQRAGDLGRALGQALASRTSSWELRLLAHDTFQEPLHLAVSLTALLQAISNQEQRRSAHPGPWGARSTGPLTRALLRGFEQGGAAAAPALQAWILHGVQGDATSKGLGLKDQYQLLETGPSRWGLLAPKAQQGRQILSGRHADLGAYGALLPDYDALTELRQALADLSRPNWEPHKVGRARADHEDRQDGWLFSLQDWPEDQPLPRSGVLRHNSQGRPNLTLVAQPKSGSSDGRGAARWLAAPPVSDDRRHINAVLVKAGAQRLRKSCPSWEQARPYNPKLSWPSDSRTELDLVLSSAAALRQGVAPALRAALHWRGLDEAAGANQLSPHQLSRLHAERVAAISGYGL